ncbi:MAG: hypothetical protein J6V36_04650, partial [Clostridia bacterium]|nr:hypothetical protein [Clostridia bacterium]
ELYGIFGVDSAPVKLTEVDGYFDKYGAVFANSKLIVFYVETTIAFTENSFDRSCDICCAYINLGVDVALESIDYDYDEMLEKDTVYLTAYVTNYGSEPLNNVTISDGNGFEYLFEGVILSGETKDIKFEYTFTESKNVTFSASTNDDLNSENNIYNLVAEVSEFKVNAKQIVVGDKNYLSLSVNNYGTKTGEVALKVFADNEKGEVIYTENLILENGEVNVEMIELDSDVLNMTDTLYVSIIPDEEDIYTLDNFVYVYIKGASEKIVEINETESTVEVKKDRLKVSEFKAAFENQFVIVTDKNGNEATDDQYVGTGFIIYVQSDSGELVYEYNVIVKGDVDGTGIVDATDYARIKGKFIGTNDTIGDDGIYFTAADVDGDGSVDATDYLRLKLHFLGQFNIYN